VPAISADCPAIGLISEEDRSVPVPNPAEPVVPYPDGAVVSAPIIRVHSRPLARYCEASDLVGSLTFRRVGERQVGTLQLRLKPSVRNVCGLPGMLAGPQPIQLLDASGNTVAAAVDPRRDYPTNPPYFENVPLRPGEAATMYLQAQGGPYRLATLTRALIRYDANELVVPVTLEPDSQTNDGQDDVAAAFWYGPFSTPGHPIAIQPPAWGDLTATLHLPDSFAVNGSTTFQATLHNTGSAAVPLVPWPRYRLLLAGSRDGGWHSGAVEFPEPPLIIQPDQSSTLTMTHTQDGQLRPGRYTARWAIAGVATATANTIIR
jgi:hypothetical protein